ncbi:MAG: ECF transporter S component [Clostridia bacterium]|nr:ECF transporter S component [Clostridia bacterium]
MEKRYDGMTALRYLVVVAMFMAINIAMSSFGIPVPGGHLYLNDIIICTAALLLGPVSSFAVGGVGAFLGDLIFYPAPMFVTLAVRGAQSIAISLISRCTFKKNKPVANTVALGVGAVINVVGYSIGRAFFYATPAAAVLKIPTQVLMALLGAIVAPILIYKAGVGKLFGKFVHRKKV